jgi:hypothetical protein
MKIDLSPCTPFERKCALILQQVNGDENAQVYIAWCKRKRFGQREFEFKEHSPHEPPAPASAAKSAR